MVRLEICCGPKRRGKQDEVKQRKSFHPSESAQPSAAIPYSGWVGGRLGKREDPRDLQV